MRIPGRGPDLSFAHTWDSCLAAAGVVGFAGQGWLTTLDAHLSDDHRGAVTFVDASGVSWAFTATGATFPGTRVPLYRSPIGQPWRLTVADPAASARATVAYTLTDVLSGATLHFDAPGHLLSAADSYGNANTVAPSGDGPWPGTETNSGGRVLTFDDYGSASAPNPVGARRKVC